MFTYASSCLLILCHAVAVEASILLIHFTVFSSWASLSPGFSCQDSFISKSNLATFKFNFIKTKFHFKLIHTDVI